jgi:short-subunit dehydrogenase
VAARQAEGFDSVRIDHGDAASVEQGWREAMEMTGGTLDALFNNGGHGMSGAAEDVPREALELVFASNVFGVHQLTRLVLPGMIAQGHGRIVMHSSVVGYTPLRWRAAYVATKHAIEGLTNTLRVELRGTGVHVSILNTGPVASGFRENSTKLFDRWIDVGRVPPRGVLPRRLRGPASKRCPGSVRRKGQGRGHKTHSRHRSAASASAVLHYTPCLCRRRTDPGPSGPGQGPDRRVAIAF